MKEIRTIKKVEVTEVKFVADDGKEFIGENAEYECKEYERKCDVKKVTERFDRLNGTRIDVPLVNWFCNEADIWKITLKSKDDYYSMIDYFEIVEHCCDDYLEMPKEFPYTMTIIKGYEWIDKYNGDLKEGLQKALEQLG